MMTVAILTPIPVEHAAILARLELLQEEIAEGSRYVVGQFEGKYHSYKVVTQVTGVREH